MTINEAKQAAYSASGRARAKSEELLRTPNHTKADAMELLEMSNRLAVAATDLCNLTEPILKPATETPRRRRKKV